MPRLSIEEVFSRPSVGKRLAEGLKFEPTPRGFGLPPISPKKRLRPTEEELQRFYGGKVPPIVRIQKALETPIAEKITETALFPAWQAIQVPLNFAVAKARGERITPETAAIDRGLTEFEGFRKFTESPSYTTGFKTALKHSVPPLVRKQVSPVIDQMPPELISSITEGALLLSAFVATRKLSKLAKIGLGDRIADKVITQQAAFEPFRPQLGEAGVTNLRETVRLLIVEGAKREPWWRVIRAAGKKMPARFLPTYKQTVLAGVKGAPGFARIGGITTIGKQKVSNQLLENLKILKDRANALKIVKAGTKFSSKVILEAYEKYFGEKFTPTVPPTPADYITKIQKAKTGEEILALTDEAEAKLTKGEMSFVSKIAKSKLKKLPKVHIPEAPLVAPPQPLISEAKKYKTAEDVALIRKLDVAQNKVNEAVKKYGFGGITKAEQHPELIKADEERQQVFNEVYNILAPDLPIGSKIKYKGKDYTIAEAYFDTSQAVDTLKRGIPTGRTYAPRVTLRDTEGNRIEVTLQQLTDIWKQAQAPEVAPKVKPEITEPIEEIEAPEVAPEVVPEVPPEPSPEITPVEQIPGFVARIKPGQEWKTGGVMVGKKYVGGKKMTSEKAIRETKKSITQSGMTPVVEGVGEFIQIRAIPTTAESLVKSSVKLDKAYKQPKVRKGKIRALPEEQVKTFQEEADRQISGLTEDQVKDMTVNKFKKTFQPTAPPEFKIPPEMEEFIKKPRGKLGMFSILTNQMVVFTRNLKTPEIFWAVNDAHFYKLVGDAKFEGTRELRSQHEEHLEKMFGQRPKKGDFNARRVASLADGTVSPATEAEREFVAWWRDLTDRLLERVNVVRTSLGKKPIPKTEAYLHRRLTRAAKMELDIVADETTQAENIPDGIKKLMLLIPSQKRIPEIYRRSIEDPDSVLRMINERRAKEGKKPLPELYERSGPELIDAVIEHETLYPRLLEALAEARKYRDWLAMAQTNPAQARAIKSWVDSWINYQVLRRTHPVDEWINTTFRLHQTRDFLLKHLKVDIGSNPFKGLSSLTRRVVHAGGIWLNFTLAGLNMIQDPSHNIPLFGWKAWLMGKWGLYGPDPNLRRLLRYSRVWINRYPFEGTAGLHLRLWERLPAFGYVGADMNNVGTGIGASWWKEFRKDPVVLARGKGKGPTKVFSGLVSIIEGKDVDLKHQYLQRTQMRDYEVFVAQFPYYRTAMQAPVQSELGAMGETFQTWWQNEYTSFLPELFIRAFKGKTSYGRPVDAGERVGLLYFGIVLFGVLYPIYKLSKKAYRYYKRALPWLVWTPRLSPQLQMIQGAFETVIGYAQGNGNLVRKGIRRIDKSSRVFIPGRFPERLKRAKKFLKKRLPMEEAFNQQRKPSMEEVFFK